VDAHAHPHGDALRPGVPGQPALGFGSRADRLGGACESHKEGVPLGVDFVAVPGGKDLAQDLALVGQQGRVALAERLEQLGRAFDIGEQESDRAFGQVGKRDSSVRLVGHDSPPLG
jgi:hypothetical protein